MGAEQFKRFDHARRSAKKSIRACTHWHAGGRTGTLQGMVLAPDSLTNLNAQELREMVTELMAQVGEHAKTITRKDREILYRQAKIDQLTHEMAVLKLLASSAEAASTLTRRRPACLMRPSTPTSRPSSWNSSIWRLYHRQMRHLASSPNAQRCRQSCPAWTSTTNQNPPPAPQKAAAAP